MDDTINPIAKTLTQAIALQEGGGTLLPYDYKSGDEPDAPTGTAGGRYQFTAATWKNYAQQILGDSNAPMTDANQNKVAYTKINQWLKAGYSPAQAASMWNAGEGAPDSWKPGTKQAHGDTPTYVKNVQQYAQQLDQSGQSPPSGQVLGSTTQQPPQTNTGEIPTSPLVVPPGVDTTGKAGSTDASSETFTGDLSQGNYGGAAVQAGKNLLNFAFPILGDIGAATQGKTDKSALQIAGDLGLSALWFIPGIGEGAEAAIRGADLLGETGAKIAGQTIGGLATGYGADVSSKLSQGQTGAGVLTPGLGTVTGGLLGAASPLISKGVSRALPALSERPAAAFETLAEKPDVVKNAAKYANKETPETVLKTAQTSLTQLRKNLTDYWQTSVKDITDQFTGKRVGISDQLAGDISTLTQEFPQLRKALPQNLKNMSAKELIDFISGEHGLNSLPPTILTLSPKGVLARSVGHELKDLAVQTFGGKGGALDTLYNNYGTRKGVFTAASKLLAMGRNASPATKQAALNLMTSMFNANKTEYLKAIQALERATGQDITGKAAGLQFQRLLPEGKSILSHGASLLGGGWELAKAILAAPFSSPRGAMKTQQYLSGQGSRTAGLLGNAAKALPVRATTAVTGLLSPTQQTQ